jgi:hypothetical protein
MSFLKKLFGGSTSDTPQASAVTAQEDYKGFTIVAEPYKAEGQFQVAGRVVKIIDGEEKRHAFIRADRFPAQDDATQVALLKGRQLIDQLGDRLFK